MLQASLIPLAYKWCKCMYGFVEINNDMKRKGLTWARMFNGAFGKQTMSNTLLLTTFTAGAAAVGGAVKAYNELNNWRHNEDIMQAGIDLGVQGAGQGIYAQKAKDAREECLRGAIIASLAGVVAVGSWWALANCSAAK
jgi:hypothetical protein